MRYFFAFYPDDEQQSEANDDEQLDLDLITVSTASNALTIQPQDHEGDIHVCQSLESTSDEQKWPEGDQANSLHASCEYSVLQPRRVQNCDQKSSNSDTHAALVSFFVRCTSCIKFAIHFHLFRGFFFHFPICQEVGITPTASKLILYPHNVNNISPVNRRQSHSPKILSKSQSVQRTRLVHPEYVQIEIQNVHSRVQKARACPDMNFLSNCVFLDELALEISMKRLRTWSSNGTHAIATRPTTRTNATSILGAISVSQSA